MIPIYYPQKTQFVGV